MPESYSAVGYGRMLVDRTRMEPYAAALRAAVRPGCVVLDLGTGTGAFALLAARLGARKVYAVDPADVIRVGRELARANGLADRIEFVQDVSTRFHPAERADVIVSDLRGILPPFQEIVATTRDARERLLAPGGVLIPRADTLVAAPVEAPDAWDDAAGPAEVMGLDLAAARRHAVNEWTRQLFPADVLLADPADVATLDYRTCVEPDVRGAAEWTVRRAATAHGFAVWFRTELGDGIGFHTGPGVKSIYQTAFFPWPRPVELAPGDRVRAGLQARLVTGEYVWIWETAIERDGRPPLAFRQSTFLANPPSPGRLRKHADAFVPALDDEGRVDAFVLARMDGAASLGQIARELQAAFPERYPTWEAALGRAGALSERYAR